MPFSFVELYPNVSLGGCWDYWGKHSHTDQHFSICLPWYQPWTSHLRNTHFKSPKALPVYIRKIENKIQNESVILRKITLIWYKDLKLTLFLKCCESPLSSWLSLPAYSFENRESQQCWNPTNHSNYILYTPSFHTTQLFYFHCFTLIGRKA